MSRWMTFLAFVIMIIAVTYAFGLAGSGMSADDWKYVYYKASGCGTGLFLHWIYSK